MKYVIDVTISYEHHHAVLTDIFSSYPATTRLYYRIFPVTDIPLNPYDTHEWLKCIWQQKDAILLHFQDNGQFLTNNNEIDTERNVPTNWTLILVSHVILISTFVLLILCWGIALKVVLFLCSDAV